MNRAKVCVAAQLAQFASISVALCWTSVAYAALGGEPASIAADQSELHGTLAVTERGQYELREISTASGMTVREFINSSGVIFAVSWSGPAVPNLPALLGSHYAEAARALSQLQRPGTHRSLRLETAELVVEMSGHMRSYSGLALLKAQSPAGLSPAELR